MNDPIGGFGKPDDVLRQISQADLESLNAAGGHVARQYACMVTIGDDPPHFCGSGTLVRVGDEVYVATAKHLFDKRPSDARACFWWGMESDHECVRIQEIRWPPGGIDIAAAKLDSDCQGNGLPLDRIELDPVLDGSEFWLISGISQTGVDLNNLKREISVVWWTLGLCPLPRDRWPKLDPSPSPDRDLFAHYSNNHALDQGGERMDGIDPHGLSGGGMWAVRMNGNGVWSPGSATRLIGIERVTSENKWSWLVGTKLEEWLKLVFDNWPGAGTTISAEFPSL